MKSESSSSAGRVGIVATDPLRLLGLEAILGRGPGPDGQPGMGFEVLSLANPQALGADGGLEFVLIDSVATGHLFELIAEFRQGKPGLHLIVLGPESDLDHIERVIGAGVRGYLSNTAREPELRMAIEVVRDGSVWAPRKVLARLLDRGQHARDDERDDARNDARNQGMKNGPSPDSAQSPSLTPRELEVLKLLMAGYPNRDIAGVLGVDEGTVKGHVSRLMRKVGVGNRTALTMQAVERKMT